MGKLPKKYIKAAGGINKKAWRLYRASKGGRKAKSSPGRYGKAKKWVKKQWGLGRMISGGRMIDVITRPIQHAYLHGAPGDFGEDIKYLYGAGVFTEGKEYDSSIAKSVYGEIGTGVATTFVKSKAGVYRGAGKGKILSIVQALSPELLAASKVDPLKDLKRFNAVRRGYDSGASDDVRGWSLDYNTNVGKMFWQDKMLNVTLGTVQKLVFNTNGPIGLNKYLPKGVNF